MTKLVEIKTCYECPHMARWGVSLRSGPEWGKTCLRTEAELGEGYLDEIPAWCPLEDGEEERDGA